MKVSELRGESEELMRVSEAFGRWRATRRGGERIPEQLWEAAVVLALREGVGPVSQSLRLDYSDLKRRVVQVGGRSKADVNGLESAAERTFVEVPGETVRAAMGAVTEGTVSERGEKPRPGAAAGMTQTGEEPRPGATAGMTQTGGVPPFATTAEMTATGEELRAGAAWAMRESPVWRVRGGNPLPAAGLAGLEALPIELELKGPDGAELRLKLPGATPVPLLELVREFWARGER